MRAAAPGRGDGAAIRHFALIAVALAATVSPRAEGRDRATNRLHTSKGSPGVGGGAWFSRAGQRGDRDRVCGRGSDADYRHGRRGDAEGSGCGAGRWTAVMIPIASGVRVWIA